jgi:NAD(P)-dependent dehydrogenase (short-subunit alcohol dehydrogenase family)
VWCPTLSLHWIFKAAEGEQHRLSATSAPAIHTCATEASSSISVPAHRRSQPSRPGYAAVKSALQSFSRSAAVEWGADGIRVNTIMPLVWSEAFRQWEQNDPATFATVLDQIPLRKLGDAEHDVGRLVVFLAGPDADMITGTGIPIGGGGTYLR